MQPVKQDLVTKDTDVFVPEVTMEINVNGVGMSFVEENLQLQKQKQNKKKKHNCT